MSLVSEPLIHLEQLSQMNKAAGEPLRLGILQLLRQGAFGVLELCQIFEVKQSGMSHHLKVLAQAGLVSTQREGNSIFYRRPLLAADRKSTRLNSSHVRISYAVFCLKKKT